jgi:chromosomal replication initiator protein
VTSRVWEDFLTIIREEAGSRVVETWFKAVSLRQWDAFHQVVYLEVPNSFVREWIKSNYLSLMQVHLCRLLNVHELKIVLLDARDQIAEKKPEPPAPMSEMMVPPREENKADSTALARANNSRSVGHINKNYSFESFIVGPHNALAYAAAYAVTERPGQVYNPLFICSDSGLGKTHLLHAIGNRIKTLHKKSLVLCQATERFVNEFVHAIRLHKEQQFHSKYRAVDVLLMDDVQYIARKEQTQEAFFHIFNSLYDARKQIVFSGATTPREMDGLNDRLKSRLGGGLITDIEEPLIETKIAILKRKAIMTEHDLDDEVAAFIAAQSSGNIRELEGALVRVIAFSSLTNQKVSMDLVRKILARPHGSVSSMQSHSVDCDSILRAVARYYPYTVAELKSKSRHKDISFVRHLSIFLMKKYTEKSLRDIGREMGGRDHTTVLHALLKMERYIQDNQSMQDMVHRIESEIMR